jgi:hypothetical protein
MLEVNGYHETSHVLMIRVSARKNKENLFSGVIPTGRSKLKEALNRRVWR